MKKIFTRLRLLTLLAVCGYSASAQSNFWSDISETGLNQDQRKIVPKSYRTLSLDTSALKAYLETAPQEFSAAARTNPLIIGLPMPDGSFKRFKVVKYDMMEPGLAAMFPNMRAYSGQGIDDPYATIKLDWNYMGFHAQVLSSVNGAIYIDPYALGNLNNYISYNKSDLKPRPFTEDGVEIAGGVPASAKAAAGPIGQTLRRYRLALACTGEYARAATGKTSPTVAQTLSALQTTTNRVNGVYETELAIRLVLIDSNTKVVYTDPATDPFSGNNNANTLITESQTVITNNIGAANFDIGHTTSTGGGGLAGLGVVCTAGQKARGITGSPQPTGDGYDIDYVAHEMGHQFGGSHTFNASTGSCSGNGSSTTNAEPGSGITIQAYAGICLSSNDLSPHSIPYFHAISYNQMVAYSQTGAGNACPIQIATGNNPPVVRVPATPYTIPKSTPFDLTGSATDPDNDALTYSWEQIDVGAGFSNWNAPSGPNAPIFRSFEPTPSPTRSFPKIANQISNTSATYANTTIGEFMPTYARPMKFRLTARDNRPGGGGVNFAEKTITVSGTAGPFSVTSQNSATSFEVGTSQTITWDVSGTTAAPISTANVTIEMSTDGGNTFPITLACSTPNDGSEVVFIPNNVSSTARIRVRAIGNIFYDMNNSNINVTAASTPKFIFNRLCQQKSCKVNDPGFNISTEALSGFTSPVTLSATGNPAGTTVVFAQNPLTPGSADSVTIQGNVAPGDYTITITGTAGSATDQFDVVITVLAPAAVEPLAPADKSGSVAIVPKFSWKAVPDASGYNIEVSQDATFATVAFTGSNVPDTVFTSPVTLPENTVYYWRVFPITRCGLGNASAVFAFKTGAPVCGDTTYSTNVPVTIPTTVSTVNSTLAIAAAQAGTIADVNVIGLKGTHTYVGDLEISLVSPAGTSVKLFSEVCSNTRYQNFDVNFDDQATSNTLPCPPTSGLVYQPLESLSAFNGENNQGTWTLKVSDLYAQDGGSLTRWGLRFCTFQSVFYPVNWMTFAGKKNENNTVTLNWSTANEINNVYYIVERSNDGTHYTDLAKIAAGNNPGMVQNYIYLDGKPASGANYYRLRQVDRDGKFSYSKVVRMFIDKNNSEYVVYPNPAYDKSTVRMLTDLKNVTIRFADASGKVVYQKSVSAVKAGEEVVIPVKQFSKGLYVLTFSSERGTSTQKVMVQQ